jgi:predicted nuclease with RNAse H fold
MIFLGIDLAGVETRNSGICILDENLKAKVLTLGSDDDIIYYIIKIKPDIIAIDAPLSLPFGRCCLKDTCSCRNRGHLRQCDRELLKMKIKFFPVTLGPMRKLTERGMKLKKIIEEKGFKIIEVYPGGAQDMLKIPRKQKGIDELRKGLMKIGVKGISKMVSHDELDAITSALVGKMYIEGDYLALGNPEEGLIIMPKRFP